MTDLAGDPRGPGQETPDTIAAQDAELATEVSEARQPQERRRLTAAFAAAARSGARLTRRGARAARRGTFKGTGWLARQGVAMAPGLRVRNREALPAQVPALSTADLPDALITRAPPAS